MLEECVSSEGMLSLGPYRVPDAGRAMAEIVDDVPERVAKDSARRQTNSPRPRSGGSGS